METCDIETVPSVIQESHSVLFHGVYHFVHRKVKVRKRHSITITLLKTSAATSRTEIVYDTKSRESTHQNSFSTLEFRFTNTREFTLFPATSVL